MSKPVRNPTSSFSLNIFNKIDTVSECAWVSVTNIPEGSVSQRAESYSHRLEAVKTSMGVQAQQLVVACVMVDGQLWMRSHVADGAMGHFWSPL